MTILLIALVAAVLSAMLVAAFQPNHFRTTRSQMMNVPASTVFPYVNNLQKFNSWSPWAKLEPEAIVTFDGPTEGVGAGMRWVGKKTGQGSMTCTESTPNDRIEFRLEFLKPFKNTATTEFAFNHSGNVTNVTWSMYGRQKFVGKLMGVFINCDKMIGKQYEQGLANLKALVEGTASDAA